MTDNNPTICDRCYRPIEPGDPRLVHVVPTDDGGEIRIASYHTECVSTP